MFKLRRSTSPDGSEMRVAGALNSELLMDQAGTVMQAQMIRQITDELAKMWIEKYGAELLDIINPEDVQKHIKTKLAEKILEEKK